MRNGDGTRLVLNKTDFEFFVKMLKTEKFKNLKNWSQEQTKGSIIFFKQLELGPKLPF